MVIETGFPFSLLFKKVRENTGGSEWGTYLRGALVLCNGLGGGCLFREGAY